jgi:hypothetical protein
MPALAIESHAVLGDEHGDDLAVHGPSDLRAPARRGRSEEGRREKRGWIARWAQRPSRWVGVTLLVDTECALKCSRDHIVYKARKVRAEGRRK